MLQAVDLLDSLSRRAGPGTAGDRLCRRHRWWTARCESWPRPPGSNRAGTSRSRSRYPSRRGSPAAARTPPPRYSSRTRRCDEPLSAGQLSGLAASLGADVPFFLASGPQLGTGDGTVLEPLDLPLDYAVLLLLPEGAAKLSTAAVYEAFDRRGGEEGFEARRAAAARGASPRPDAPRSRGAPAATTWRRHRSRPSSKGLGAFRADVSGAGPARLRALRRRGRRRGCSRRAERPRRHPGLRSAPWYG